MAMLERETSAQIGEGLACASFVEVISGSSVRLLNSLATETTGGEILVAFLAQKRSQSA